MICTSPARTRPWKTWSYEHGAQKKCGGLGKAGQGRAGQDRAGQGRAGQGRTGQGRARTGVAQCVLKCNVLS